MEGTSAESTPVATERRIDTTRLLHTPNRSGPRRASQSAVHSARARSRHDESMPDEASCRMSDDSVLARIFYSKL